jgi:hypothetical protein
MPFLILAAIGQGLVHVLTKPWPWLLLAGWLVATQFDLGLFAAGLRHSLWELWPLILAILAAWVAREAVRQYFARRK